MSPIYPCNQILKIHHQWFLTNCHIKPWILNETIHQKMGFFSSETEIWYASLALRKNWYIILQDQKYQLHFILCKDLWMKQ
jgi:hypothetical protein